VAFFFFQNHVCHCFVLIIYLNCGKVVDERVPTMHDRKTHLLCYTHVVACCVRTYERNGVANGSDFGVAVSRVKAVVSPTNML